VIALGTTPETRKLSISIKRSASEAYEFLSAPAIFAKWIAQRAQGPVDVRLIDRNSLGVLDYSLTQRDGASVYVPLRIVATASGCDLVLTLFRHKGMPDEKFASAMERAMCDLQAAKRILEAQ
jgi:hypothetical protein